MTALRTLSPLDRKVLRQLWQTRGQSLAIALVIACGVATFVMARGMIRSLDETRLAYYERYRFADVFAPAKRVPDRLLREIAALPGVAQAESRISAGVLVDVPGFPDPVTGRAVSLPDLSPPALNRVFLRRGRMLEPFRDDEVLLSEAFAEAHGLEPGDELAATLYGTRRTLRIVGIALSPEFIYTIAPGELVPDDRRFAVLWMGRDALASAFDLDGASNEILLGLARGASRERILDDLDRLLEPYGGTAAYGRDRQLSDRFLESELEQLGAMAAIMPTVFLVVAAFLLNIVIARRVEAEREQIGLLKAFGYTHRAVAFHYAKLVLVTTWVGSAVGCGLGIWLGRGLANIYQDFFKFPFLLFRAGTDVLALAIGVAVLAAGLGVALAIARAARLTPAVAMQPPVPPDYSRRGIGRGRLVRFLDPPTRMIVRQLSRRPGRAALTCVGVGFAVGILVMSRFQLDSIEHLVEVSFGIAERQDLSVGFVEPLSPKTVLELRRLPGVIDAEAYRSVPVRLVHGHRERREGILGLRPGADLSRPINTRLAPIEPPEHGILLSQGLADRLEAKAGDRLTVHVLEGRQPTLELPVSGVAEAFLGTPAYMRLAAVNRVLQEGRRVSGAHLRIDTGHQEEIYRALKDMPAVAGVSIRTAAKRSFRETLDESIGTFTLILTGFASLIAVGVVYNGARIALAERSRELATLRVLGLTHGETSYILLGELALLTVLALPLGAVLGYALAWLQIAALDTDLYRMPLVVTPVGIGYAGAVIVAAAVASGLLVAWDIRRLDLVAVLKTRE